MCYLLTLFGNENASKPPFYADMTELRCLTVPVTANYVVLPNPAIL
jgi:hypothetical protein